MDIFDFYLPHVTAENAIQLVAWKSGTPWSTGASYCRAKTRSDIDSFVSDNIDSCHLYFATSLMAESGKGRGDATFARTLPLLYADLDTQGGTHKGGLPTKKEVAELLNSEMLVEKPSYIIDTGGGFQAFWLFDQPIDLSTDRGSAEKALLGLNDRLHKWYGHKGWKYERLKDLARVMRIPGSKNHKTDPPKQTCVVWPKYLKDPATFAFSDIAYEPRKEEPKKEPSGDVGSSDAVTAAMAACAKVEPSWGEDGSGYMLKLCRQCVRKGCTADQTYSVVKGILDAHEDYPTKWSKEDILRRYRSATEQSDVGEDLKKKFETTEHGIAKRIVEVASQRGTSLYIPEWKTWLSWSGKHFRVSKSAFYETIVDVMKEMETEDDQKSWVSMCRSYRSRKGFENIARIAEEYMQTSFTELNKQHLALPLMNGVVKFDQDGGHEFVSHNYSFKNTHFSDTVYDAEATCPRWEQFLGETLVSEDGEPDVELREYMQKVFGYCLTGLTDAQAMFILYGDGRNGKGVFTRTLSKILGEYATSAQQELLMGNSSQHPTLLANLHGRRAVFTSETDQECRLKEAQVKMLSGDDEISCRRMRQDNWSFLPTHKLFLSTNHIPQIRGTDNGIWRRLKMIPFNACFDGRIDPNLEDRDIPSELSGILNWGIEGYRMMIEGRTADSLLGEPEVVKTSVREHQSSMDIISMFIEDECIVDLEKKPTVDNQKLYQALTVYCNSYNEYCPSQMKLAADLKKRGISSHRTKKERFKVGICLRSEFDESDPAENPIF